MPSPLELTTADRERLGRAALDAVLRIFEQASTAPVYPRVEAAALAAQFAEDLPRVPQDAQRVIDMVASEIAAACRNNGHPRMLGYVSSPADFVGVLGDFLASAINQNVTSWRSAPGATTLERLVVRWLVAFVGYGEDAGGILLSGGSTANLTALLVALRAAAGSRLIEEGVSALGAVGIYASPMVHMSIGKAAEVLGLGRRALRPIAMRDDLTLDPAALEAQLARDRAGGIRPLAVVANAGDVNAGVVDPLDAIADVCARAGVWLHVDGCYGGFAARAPSARHLFAGLARADSLSLDPHKWLFAPIDAGCLLVRDPARLAAAFSAADSYVSVLGAPFDFAFWGHGIELSRRFRALKIWMMLKTNGADAYLAAIDANVRTAAALAALVDDSPDFERLAPAPLGIVCFRYAPAALRWRAASDDPGLRAESAKTLDTLNRAITVELQRGGHEAYLSNTSIGGRFALRVCLANYRTTDNDLPILLEAIRRIGRKL